MAQVTLWGAHQFARMLFSRDAAPPAEYFVAIVRTETVPDPFISGHELDEPETEDYSRVAVPNDQTHWITSLDAVINNGQEIRFPTAAEDWGEFSYWAICDAAEEGNIYLFGEFQNPIYISAGDALVVDPEALQLEFSEIYEEISDA